MASDVMKASDVMVCFRWAGLDVVVDATCQCADGSFRAFPDALRIVEPRSTNPGIKASTPIGAQLMRHVLDAIARRDHIHGRSFTYHVVPKGETS